MRAGTSPAYGRTDAAATATCDSILPFADGSPMTHASTRRPTRARRADGIGTRLLWLAVSALSSATLAAGSSSSWEAMG